MADAHPAPKPANSDSTEADAFQRLAARAISLNDLGPMMPDSITALGLTMNGDEFIVYQIEGLAGSDAHYFNLAKDGSGRIILFSRIDKVVYLFALDAQYLPASAAVRHKGQQSAAVSIESVRPQLMRVMAFWMDWAAKNTTTDQG